MLSLCKRQAINRFAKSVPDLIVQVVTARSEYLIQCSELLWNSQHDIPIIRESVKIAEDGHITIIIDADHVDDIPTSKIFNMISQTMDELENHAGIVYFSEPLLFLDSLVTKH